MTRDLHIHDEDQVTPELESVTQHDDLVAFDGAVDLKLSHRVIFALVIELDELCSKRFFGFLVKAAFDDGKLAPEKRIVQGQIYVSWWKTLTEKAESAHRRGATRARKTQTIRTEHTKHTDKTHKPRAR